MRINFSEESIKENARCYEILDEDSLAYFTDGSLTKYVDDNEKKRIKAGSAYIKLDIERCEEHEALFNRGSQTTVYGIERLALRESARDASSHTFTITSLPIKISFYPDCLSIINQLEHRTIKDSEDLELCCAKPRTETLSN